MNKKQRNRRTQNYFKKKNKSRRYSFDYSIVEEELLKAFVGFEKSIKYIPCSKKRNKRTKK